MDLQLALRWFQISSIEKLDLLSLKKKYRKLTLKYHPDKGGKTTDFVQLQAAYIFLQDCIKYPHSHKVNQENDRSSSSTNYSTSEATNSQDIEFYKNQIDQLQKSNLNYQNLINLQIKAIQQFYNNLDQIKNQGDNYNSNLSKLLDDELAKLDKKYKSGWWKGIIGMKSMDKNDLIYYQNQLINEHNELLAKSQRDNLQANYKEYQEVLEKIVEKINQVDK
jgi:curved DNA-binding protein CbpA